MKTLNNYNTWDLVKLTNGKKVAGCKWVSIVKHKAHRSMGRYKAILVAKGFTEASLVAKMNSI